MLTHPVDADDEDPARVVPIEPLGDAFVISDADVGDEPAALVGVAGATVDPVKDYLQQIGRVPLLTAEQEVELAIRIEAGLFAAERLNSDAVLDQQLRGDLERIAEDGRRAKDRMMEAHVGSAVRDGCHIPHPVSISASGPSKSRSPGNGLGRDARRDR